MSPNSNTHQQTQVRFCRQPWAGGFLMWALLAVAPVMIASGCSSGPAATESAPQSVEVPSEPQVILVTGSTSGLGRGVALELASTGAHIIVHGRNRERGMEVVNQIEQEGIGSAKFYAADLASFDQVREFAETILQDYEKVDVLVNNAGIHLAPEDGRLFSVEGHELTFAVNYLSGYLRRSSLQCRRCDRPGHEGGSVVEGTGTGKDLVQSASQFSCLRDKRSAARAMPPAAGFRLGMNLTKPPNRLLTGFPRPC